METKRHNAWLVESNTFSHFLDLVYADHWGEIWLYNNDLKVLRDPELFEKLYLNRIGDVLSEHVDAVKLLLGPRAFSAFAKPSQDDKLVRNLARLTNKRLSTFYVGELKTANPPAPKSISVNNTLVFYTIHGELSADAGVVMLRYNRYPFSKPKESRIAVCWKLRDEETLKGRLQDSFQRIFENPTNFRWIKVSTRRPKFSFSLQKDISPETKRLRSLRNRSRNELVLMDGDRADVGIVAALSDEFQAVKKLLPNAKPVRGSPGTYYAAVPHKGGASYGVVLTQSPVMGNADAAVTTTSLLQRWNPAFVFLVGIAGGNKEVRGLHLGDVVIATDVHAYEYCKKTRRREEHEPRKYPSSADVLTAVKQFAPDWTGKVAERRPKIHHLKRRRSKSFEGVVASGSKLIADDYFMRNLLKRDRKIVAVEMEGEGVMVAASHHTPRPDVLVLKGISDYADSRSRSPGNKDKWRLYTAKAAATFVIDFLREGLLPRRAGQ